MFELGASELLLIVIVAVVVIGPKDLPLAMRTAGRWVGKVRRVSNHFRTGIEAMIREAELEEMEQKWKAQNEAIMRANPDASSNRNPEGPEDLMAPVSASAEAAATRREGNEAGAETRGKTATAEPQLPLPPP